MHKFLFTVLLLLASTFAHADILGVRASGGVFDYSVSGTIRDSGSPSDAVDLKNDLHLANDKKPSGFLYFEHPLPIIPNIRLGTTDLKLAGQGTVTKTFNFNGQNYTGSTNVATSIDLSHTDLGLYYEIIDTGFDFDLGLNFKLFNGKASLTQGGTTTTQKIDVVVPMLYGAVSVPILNSGFYLAGDLSVVTYNKNEVSDILLRLRYQTALHLGVEAGLRSLKFKINKTSDQLYGDMTVKGPYLNLFVYF
ncbi:MAG: TIGR04219 family outer membrane beta-barrel protein [Gammaproteobacteria bacterium]|nr:TIGR04219 family outer membrane beta-barrel protein [Gammaproteobacteria bacterium]